MYRSILLSMLLLPCTSSAGQSTTVYQTDFDAAELSERRARVMDAIGDRSVALVQGAPDVDGFAIFRQSNTLYYLTGIETPHAYLLIDGRNRTSFLYLPHEDPARERGEGNTLSAEDAGVIQTLTGVDGVHAIEYLPRHWIWASLVRQPHPTLYVPFSPAETGTDSRDELLRFRASVTNDPWDEQPSREGAFIQLLRERYPQYEIRDLTPILDSLRSIKSDTEVDMIRRASQLAGYGLLEAMRCTKPGVWEYQLEACARYVHQINGARRDAYNAIVGGGKNAFMGHYSSNNAVLEDGDLVLMDFAPEYHYYTSDVTRIWPVNGKFSREQLELYNFIVAYRAALMGQIRPGVTVTDVLTRASAEMKKYVEDHAFSKPEYERAVVAALTFRGHMQHPVGMAVHDIGDYKSTPLQVGEVFSVDPMIWVPEEKLYVRIEDVVVVTETGVENFTDCVPVDPVEIEAILQERGVLEFRPAQN